MPRYFINFMSGGQLSEDDQGQDLPGLDEAKAAGLASARELLADAIKANRKDPLEAVIITNDRGVEICRIFAKDVLPDALK